MKAIKSQTKKNETTITAGNVVTTITLSNNEMMKRTISTVTTAEGRKVFSLIRNGAAPAKYEVTEFLNLFDYETQKVEEVKVGEKSLLTKDHFDRDGENDRKTLLALRQVILDYAEEVYLDFYSALFEVAKVSTILQSELSTREVGILLDIPSSEVEKIETAIFRKLNSDKFKKANMKLKRYIAIGTAETTDF